MSSNTVDITVVTYNSARVLPRLLVSVLAQSFDPRRISLAFADNGSRDGTLELLERWRREHGSAFAAVHILPGNNDGFGAGHNRASRAGHAPFIFVLNPDTELTPDCLTRLLETAIADERRVAAWEARQLPYEHPKVYDPVTLEAPWVSGACVLLRRAAFDTVGGFDPRIFLYCEDVDLSWRLRKAGWRLRYVPRANVWHFSYATPGEVKRAQLAGSLLGNLYLRARFGSRRDLAQGIVAYCEVVNSPPPLPGIRRDLVANLGRFTRDFSYFRNGGCDGTFRFYGWDYSPRRTGDFYESVPCEALPRRPKVSILMRTIGRLPLLRRALATVANQTYAPIEVVVVEDGGNRARDIAAEFPTLDLVYVALERKVGRSAAGNVGLERATGEYCNFLDEDDELYADHVEQLVAAVVRTGKAAAYAVAFEAPSRIEKDEIVEEGDASVVYRGPISRLQMLRYNQLPIQCVLFARSLFVAHGGFDVELDTLEDWNLWQRYLAAAGSFAYVDKTTSRYRVPLDQKQFAARRAKLDADYAAAVKKAESIILRVTVGDLKPELEKLRQVDTVPASPSLRAWARATVGRVTHRAYHGFRIAVRDTLFPPPPRRPKL